MTIVLNAVGTWPDMPGRFVFGLHHDRDNPQTAQVWLLRTAEPDSALRHLGPPDLLRVQRATNLVRATFVRRFGTVFNVFPKSQTQTTRWLRLCGMMSMDSAFTVQDYLLCGVGPSMQAIGQTPAVWKDYLGDLMQ